MRCFSIILPCGHTGICQLSTYTVLGPQTVAEETDGYLLSGSQEGQGNAKHLVAENTTKLTCKSLEFKEKGGNGKQRCRLGISFSTHWSFLKSSQKHPSKVRARGHETSTPRHGVVSGNSWSHFVSFVPPWRRYWSMEFQSRPSVAPKKLSSGRSSSKLTG